MAGFRVGGEESESENTEAEEGFPAQTGKARLFASGWRVALIGDKSKQIKKVLGQLLKYTEQLARSEHDPGVDVKALARSCEKQLSVLKELMPPGTIRANGECESEDERQVFEILQTLDTRTRDCIRILEAAKGRVEQEMGSLRRSRQAIRAYNGK
ncbi:MAG: hypothetical protein ABFD98_19060 [Syntrophobacteraceae bacterium]|nr:hypothetical protein [Desulfobacteraceae bacterium]